MSLVATFFFLAGLYVLLWAHTIAVLKCSSTPGRSWCSSSS